MTNQAAGCLFRDGRGHALLVKPSYKGYWDIPGGIVEEGELPKVAAQREVKEELGLSIDVGRLLVVDHLPARDNRPALVAYIFDGGHIDDTTIAVDGVEIIRWAWCGPDGRKQRTTTAPILHRRIEFAIVADRKGECFYLESGWA